MDTFIYFDSLYIEYITIDIFNTYEIVSIYSFDSLKII